MVDLWKANTVNGLREDAQGPGNPTLRRPVSWIAGLWFVIIILLLISVYTLSITPPRFFSDWRYYVAFLGWTVFAWLWLGKDAIKDRQKRSTGFLHSWLMLAIAFGLGGIAGYVPITSFVGYSAFAAILAGMSAKNTWDYQIRGRIRYCTRCGAYRWHVPTRGEVYCNKCGHKWQKNADLSGVNAPSKLLLEERKTRQMCNNNQFARRSQGVSFVTASLNRIRRSLRG